MNGKFPLHASGPTAAAANPVPLRGGEIAVIPANVQAGPNIGYLDSQTALSQLATRTFLESQDIAVATEGQQMGALTGTINGMYVSNGSSSQMAVARESMLTAVQKSLAVSQGLEFKQAGLAASERFFWITLERSFNQGEEHILNADKVPTSELAKALAIATGGVSSTNDLVQGVNNGDLGYTSPKSQRQDRRLESSGLRRRTRRS